jgi:trehalose 6-phosphate synthase/phosphatase
MPRLLLVSNRLPVTVKLERGRVAVVRSSGGLATGLAAPHEQSKGLWVGWPGDTSRFTAEQREALDAQLAELRTVPLHLSASEVSRYYEGFANGVLWPLFHYLLDRIPLHERDWEAYRRVNQRFADTAASHYRDGDTLWVHDYQLMLVPKLLREKLPHARIGFFLHIPFPGSELFRTLPWREEVLEGLLGADLVGFHTLGYVRHFMNTLQLVLGLAPNIDRVRFEGREVRLGAFPMGIDAASFAAMAELPQAQREVARLRRGDEKLILGVDRLDYTKGIRRRLLAVDRLLEKEPSLRGKVRLLQVCVPSREKVPEYAAFREEVERQVGRINGLHGTPFSTPVQFLFRSFSAQRLAAMYRAADVMLVSALRDGMNLVAKEFAASRVDGDGVLVLSELAGAANELGEALLVNPYDIDDMADALHQALTMPEGERRQRMRGLRRQVFTYDIHRWVRTFLDALDHAGSTPVLTTEPSPEPQREDVYARIEHAPRRTWLLDYDGTLVSFNARPEAAYPDRVLRELLFALALTPGDEVHVVSGRPREELEPWLGDLPLHLHAEHGLWSRDVTGRWHQVRRVPTDWREPVRELFAQFLARTPGAFLEVNSATLELLYRFSV